jgi:4-amino-4-deoxy-L-arabinose transferase-like glycosyltransferase
MMAAALLLLFFFFFRILDIDAFPLFIDETVHLYTAENILRDSSPLFQVWLGRQFTIWWIALFQAPFTAPVFVARVATLLTLMIGAAALLALARRLGGVRALWIAGALYALSPYHLFFERLALADTVAGSEVLLAAYAAARLQKRAEWTFALLTGAALFFAFGAKASALPYYGIPLAAVVALTPRTRPLAQTVRWLLLAYGSALGLTALYIGLVRLRGMDVLGNSLAYALSDRGNVDTRTLFSLERLLVNMRVSADVLTAYWSLPVLLVLVAALLWLCWRRRVYLPLLILAPWLVMWWSAIQESRYWVTAAALLIVTGAVVLAELATRSRRAAFGVQAAVAVCCGVAILSWLFVPAEIGANALYDSWRSPPRATLDQLRYVHADASGFNLREAAAAVAGRGDAVQVFALLANCQALRYMTLDSLPVTCVQVYIEAEANARLVAEMEAQRGAGVYLIFEIIPSIPQDMPGRLITTITAPIAERPAIRIHSLAP